MTDETDSEFETSVDEIRNEQNEGSELVSGDEEDNEISSSQGSEMR